MVKRFFHPFSANLLLFPAMGAEIWPNPTLQIFVLYDTLA